MQSLEAKFATVVEKLSEPQRKKFDQWLREARGKYGEYRHKVTIEMQLAAAERIGGSKVTTESLREPIRRNNGPGWGPVSESRTRMQEAESKYFRQLGMKAEDVERFQSGGLPQQIREASEQVKADYRFLRAIRISEKDAIRGALDNTLRNGARRIELRD